MVGAVSPAFILYRHGLGWTYGGRSTLTATFWTSLTVLDPTAALLLLLRPRIGLVVAVVVMVVDVAHNLVVVGPDDFRVIDQMVFLTAVVASVPFLWRRPHGRDVNASPTRARRPC